MGEQFDASRPIYAQPVSYTHLTLFPAAYFNGVTVLCSDSGLADCLTTGLFCQPLEDGMKTVESLDGVEAV